MKTYDILCIGNYTKDTIISPAGIRKVDGGAVNYAAHAAGRIGAAAAVVTHLAREDERVVEKFTAAGIDCFPIYTSFSTLMKLEYPTSNPDIRSLSVTATADPIRANEVESISTRAAVIGSSLRGEVETEVIRALKGRGVLVAADMQGFVRVLDGETLSYRVWPEMAETLAHLDILKSDAVEAEFLTGEKDIFKAARFFAAMGPREIVLTHKDGLLIHSQGEDYEMGFFPARLDGRSGRGDTCLGSYVAKRLTLPPCEAGIWAAAVTSLKMEDSGPFDRPMRDVEALIQKHYNGLRC